jgi:predicted MFS family arabinose efflux permease
LETGLLFGVQGVASVAAGLLVPRFVGRIGAGRTLASSLLVQGVFIAVMLGIGPHSGVLVAAVGISLASAGHLGAVVSYGLTVTSGVPDEEQGLATGLVTTTQQVGVTIGIPLLGVLATTQGTLFSGVRTVLAVAAALLLATAVAVAAGLRGAARR